MCTHCAGRRKCAAGDARRYIPYDDTIRRFACGDTVGRLTVPFSDTNGNGYLCCEQSERSLSPVDSGGRGHTDPGSHADPTADADPTAAASS